MLDFDPLFLGRASAARLFLLNLLIVCALAVCLGARAAPLGTTCNTGPQPSASLLLPFFEVDLEDAAGPTTLVSIGSTATEPRLARVTLWTDWGIPTLSFDLLLPSYGVVPINLRDVFHSGSLPQAASELARPASCADPLSQPVVDVVALGAQHRGDEYPLGSGQCWASMRQQQTVVGFLTVDVLDDCSDEIRFPSDDGYFAAAGGGLASNDNVLFGDFFLVEPRQDFAQGAALVHLPADPEVAGVGSVPSFYGFVPGVDRSDQRRPLASRYLTRFFNGGAFTGGTELLLWQAPWGGVEPVVCGSRPAALGGGGSAVTSDWAYRVRGEAGDSPTGFYELFNQLAFASRLRLDESLVGDLTAGVIDLWSLTNCGICSPPFSSSPGIVLPLHAAEGRFSVGLEAIVLDDFCSF